MATARQSGSADGLWSVLPSDGRPIPLALAGGYLQRALGTLDVPPELAAEQPNGWRILRAEVPIAPISSQANMSLDWLAAQTGHLPRVLFSSRDRSVLLAGVGAAHSHSGNPSNSDGADEAADDMLPQLGGRTHRRIRYVGGVRFDSSDPEATGKISPEWQPFGRCCWILPRIELTVVSHDTPSRSGANASEASSVGMSTLAGTDIRIAELVLAVQLRWNPSVPGSWAAERANALEALGRLRPISSVGQQRLGLMVSRSEDATQDNFEDRVRGALEAFKGNELKKVVLARRVDLELLHTVDAVDVLRQVVGNSQKRHYLFLLEPSEGTAFVSLTPERLCKVQGPDMWTEAVAGTWPIAEFNKIGEAALLASSKKHSGEHQVVSDYICGLLDKVATRVQVCDTHILKLKHLVHIKQSFHATAAQDSSLRPCADEGASASGPFGLSTWFCKHMSPTPAVCGLPLDASRTYIRASEKFDRGLYAAPCGIVSAHDSELIVALRSALMRDGRRLHVYAGAGIVPGSNPAEEYDEISLKMRQFTEGFPAGLPSFGTAGDQISCLTQMPNLNSLWASLIIEECSRLGVTNFVICAGSRSTPLVVAISRHPGVKYVMNHDERGAAYYALGWAKALGKPVGVVVTSGTAVANLVPGAVEAAVARVPLLLLTADRPPELRETGANQTITQPGLFATCSRWSKDFPCPSVEYPAHVLLSDIDLAVAHATGQISQNPGPVHLNFCFRENLAPDAGPVRGAPDRTSQWDEAYISNSPQMHRWAQSGKPRSSYVEAEPGLGPCDAIESLCDLVRSKSRIVVLVGSLFSAEEASLAEDIALRLQAAVFADITSGLRQRPNTVHYADQLLYSPLLAGNLLQVDAVVQLGSAVCSARLAAFLKASGAPLHLRVCPAPVRLDPDHSVTHHLRCSLRAFAGALAQAGMEPSGGTSSFWSRLSSAADKQIEAVISSASGLTEPFVARCVSDYIAPEARLCISSSMPIRDLDFFGKPMVGNGHHVVFAYPPMANRGASGIDGVISTALGYCRGSGVPATLLIGDTATLHDLNALQQMAGPDAPPLTMVVVNNGGGAIFSFLPIAKHKEYMQCFDAPHATNFAAACSAFGVAYSHCTSPDEFRSEYMRSQVRGAAGPRVIEACISTSFEDNVNLHKRIGMSVAASVRSQLLAELQLNWMRTSCQTGSTSECSKAPYLLLHGWLGEMADWADVSRLLSNHGCDVLAVDLPGHGARATGSAKVQDPWKSAALHSIPMMVEALTDLLDSMHIAQVNLVGYSLGGRIAMAFSAAKPDRVMGTLAISANPGLNSVAERQKRWKDDSDLAKRIAAMKPGAAFQEFLSKWYSAPLWGNLADRSPEVYSRMLGKRGSCTPNCVADSLLGMSLARQDDLWSTLMKGKPFWYASGELDSKFSALGTRMQEMSSKGGSTSSTSQLSLSSISGAGHALVEECPDKVAEFCLAMSSSAALPKPAADLSPTTELPVIDAIHLQPVEVLLKVPLVLSRGDAMPCRSGILVILQARIASSGSAEGVLAAGLGECSPLPHFHKETLAEANAQLQAVVEAWTSSPPGPIPVALSRLDGSMSRWLEEHCPQGNKLLPSVRCSLEMALLHLICRATGSAHLAMDAAAARSMTCISSVGINSLVTRKEDLTGSSSGASVVKLKVGKDPEDDAKRTNQLAEVLEARAGPAARLRLDANQAWTIDDAATFISNLSEKAVTLIEYLEEPLHTKESPDEFLASWKELLARTGNSVRLAVDESLTEGVVDVKDLAGLAKDNKDCIAAVLLKPALQGLERTMELSSWALEHGVRPVLTSAFESGVALCHFAILAATISPQPWVPMDAVSASHGLGTFDRLAEDVLRPPFADLVRGRAGWQVNALQCQEALHRTVDALVYARGGRQAWN